MNYSVEGSVKLDAAEVVGEIIDYLEQAEKAQVILDRLVDCGGMTALEDIEIEQKRALVKTYYWTKQEKAKLADQLARVEEDRQGVLAEWGGLSANWRKHEEEMQCASSVRPTLLAELRHVWKVVTLCRGVCLALENSDGQYLDKLSQSKVYKERELWMDVVRSAV